MQIMKLDPAMAEEVLQALVTHVARENMTVFFSDLVGFTSLCEQLSPEGVVRRTIDPGGLEQILLPEQQTGGLRTAQAFPAAVADGGSARGEMHIRRGAYIGVAPLPP